MLIRTTRDDRNQEKKIVGIKLPQLFLTNCLNIMFNATNRSSVVTLWLIL